MSQVIIKHKRHFNAVCNFTENQTLAVSNFMMSIDARLKGHVSILVHYNITLLLIMRFGNGSGMVLQCRYEVDGWMV